MNTGTQTTGAQSPTPGVTGGVASPAATGAQSAVTPATQTANGAAQGAGLNQQTTVGGAGQQQGNTIPYERFREVNQQNRQLQAMVQQTNQQLAELRQQIATRTQAPANVGDGFEGVAPEDQRILKALDQINTRRMAPVLQRLERLDSYAQQQAQQQQLEHARGLQAQIERNHPIFAHPLIGEAAKIGLQTKLAEYQANQIPVNPMDVAEEVAMHWTSKAAQYEASVTNGLVQGAQHTAARTVGTGAAVTQGGASAPMGSAIQKPKNAADAGAQYRASLVNRRAVGQA